jgi:tetratricopeptide (TPR) repeat protein
MEARLGPDHPDTLTSRSNLALAYQFAGRTAEAIKMSEATLKLQESTLGPDHPETFATMDSLARAYQVAGRLTDALPLLEGTLKRRQAQLGPDHLDTLLTMNNLAGAYLDANRWVEAEKTARECLVLLEKKQPDAWPTFDTKSILGAALLGQKNYASAEPLLLAGYQGMIEREAQTPVPDKTRLVKALERLVQLYEATGRKDQAKEWQQKLAEARAPAKPAAQP